MGCCEQHDAAQASIAADSTIAHTAIAVATISAIASTAAVSATRCIAIAIAAASDRGQPCRLLPDLAFRVLEWQHRHMHPVRNLFGLPSRPRLLGIGLVHCERVLRRCLSAWMLWRGGLASAAAVAIHPAAAAVTSVAATISAAAAVDSAAPIASAKPSSAVDASACSPNTVNANATAAIANRARSAAEHYAD